MVPTEVGADHAPPRRRRAPVRRAATTVGGAVCTVLAASFVIFCGLAAAPGDPVSQVLGSRATGAARAAKRHELGLDQPLVNRYWDWLTHALHGDLGTSLTYRQSVTDLLAPRIETTLLLVVMASVIVLIAGIGVGVAGGVARRGRPVVAVLVALAIAVPGFIAATVFISVFAVQLGWFPTFGAGSGFGDRLWHMVLPAIALSLGYAAYVAQLTSAAVSVESEKEYVLTGRGRGLPGGLILRRHILRNAALPVLTASGLAVAGLVAGTVVVEKAFAIDGIGSLLINSISSKDYAVVTAVSLLIVVVFVVVTTVIDLAQVALDPRSKGGA